MRRGRCIYIKAHQLTADIRKNKNLIIFRFAIWCICLILVFTSCRNSEAVVVEEEKMEVPEFGDLLKAYFQADTANCFYNVYKGLDFDVQWLNDTARYEELLQIGRSPYSIGLLPDSSFSLENFMTFRQDHKPDTVNGVLLLAELNSTLILNYFLQRLLYGESNLHSASCSDSILCTSFINL